MTAAPATWNFTIYQGATFDKTITLHQTDIASPVVDLTGWTSRLQIRKTVATPGTPELELLSTTGGAVPGSVAKIVMGDALGTIRLFAPASVTAALSGWTTAVYDLELIHTADGVVERKLEGTVTLSLEVTR
jgi:hypothetical protein